MTDKTEICKCGHSKILHSSREMGIVCREFGCDCDKFEPLLTCVTCNRELHKDERIKCYPCRRKEWNNESTEPQKDKALASGVTLPSISGKSPSNPSSSQEPDAFEQYLRNLEEVETASGDDDISWALCAVLTKYQELKPQLEKAIIDNYNKRLLSNAAVETTAKEEMLKSRSTWKYSYTWESLPPQSITARIARVRRTIQAAIKSADNERKGDKE